MSLFTQNYGKQKTGLIASRETTPPPPDWWNQNWKKRIRLQVADTTIYEQDEEFILFHRTLPELIGTEIDELRFIKPNSSYPEAPYHIVKFDNTTGELFVYVLLHNVSPNSELDIYFGNSSVLQSLTIHPLPYHGQFFFLNFENSLVDPTGHFSFSQRPINSTARFTQGINSLALDIVDNPYYLISNLHSRVSEWQTGFSLHCAVKLSNVNTNHGIMELSDGSVNSKALLFSENGVWKFRVVLQDGSFQTVVSTSNIVVDEWTHVAGVYHHHRDYIQIFINGVLEATLSLPEGSTLNLDDQTDVGFITIGALTNGIYQFRGLIDNAGWASFYEHEQHFYNRYRNTFFQQNFWTIGNLERI